MPPFRIFLTLFSKVRKRQVCVIVLLLTKHNIILVSEFSAHGYWLIYLKFWQRQLLNSTTFEFQTKITSFLYFQTHLYSIFFSLGWILNVPETAKRHKKRRQAFMVGISDWNSVKIPSQKTVEMYLHVPTPFFVPVFTIRKYCTR